MSELPAYVKDGNLYDGLGAVQLDGVNMHNFCLPADGAKLQAWLDKTFLAPKGVKYRALGDRVFLGIAEIQKLYLLNEHPSRGWTSEIDITIWILAQREGEGGLALRWIPAYLFVDSGPALCTGREVWGFPKQLGRFDFSPKGPDPAAARTFAADGWVVDVYGPQSQAHWAPMFEVRPAAPVRREGILGSLEELGRKAVERLNGDLVSAAGRIQSAIGMGEMTMAFLKQFPDCANPNRACYQEVVEAKATVTGHSASGLTHDAYEVRVISYDSHPYLDELGISSDWQQVGQGFWMQFDFQQDLGAVVRQAQGADLHPR
ncbi:MAG TPA: hypothetical protein VGH03_21235 [Caulobacteraceae bacterium]